MDLATAASNQMRAPTPQVLEPSRDVPARPGRPGRIDLERRDSRDRLACQRRFAVRNADAVPRIGVVGVSQTDGRERPKSFPRDRGIYHQSFGF